MHMNRVYMSLCHYSFQKSMPIWTIRLNKSWLIGRKYFWAACIKSSKTKDTPGTAAAAACDPVLDLWRVKKRNEIVLLAAKFGSLLSSLSFTCVRANEAMMPRVNSKPSSKPRLIINWAQIHNFGLVH